QALSDGFGWRAGALGFVALALVIIPAAWIAGRVDTATIPPSVGHRGDSASGKAAFMSALRHGPFMVMAVASTRGSSP
ncbi:MAG TPA: hypothetical protein PLH93_06410, partial [Flavobacteriales bacterium]|nr:hypothetical protein [Flavobacteriales bacterium]